jgi:hypothetical protein
MSCRKKWSQFADVATNQSRMIYRDATTHGSREVHEAVEKVHWSTMNSPGSCRIIGVTILLPRRRSNRSVRRS